jgi:O-antigen ligase
MFSRHQLSAWLGTVLPFCAGLAAVAGARTRIAVAATAVLGIIAIAGTNARSGALGLAVGLAVLLVVLNVARALPQVRLSAAVLSIALAALVGYAAVSVSAGDDKGGAARYTVILAPGRDTAYQARQLKWREAIDAIKRHPAGLGLGSAGGIAASSARFDSVGAHSIDNSYLKLGYEQGIGVLALFVGGLVLLLTHLVRVAMRTADPWAAALTAGAAGALASFAAIMLTGDYVEGLNALAAWLLAGLGAAAARAAVTARGV